MQTLFLEEACSQEKSEHFHFLVLSVPKNCKARTICRNVTREIRSADRKLLIETIKKDIEKVILKTVESVYQSNSNNYPNFVKFCVPSFRSEKSNTKMDR